jgi:hypothetical protein
MFVAFGVVAMLNSLAMLVHWIWSDFPSLALVLMIVCSVVLGAFTPTGDDDEKVKKSDS